MLRSGSEFMPGRIALGLGVAAALLAAGCGQTQGERALSGAGIGAGVGAAAGAITGGSVITGAAVGAGVGAATGALTDADDLSIGGKKKRR